MPELDEKWISNHELAHAGQFVPNLGIARSTLDNAAARGYGPPFYRVGRLIRYDATEVQAWIDAGYTVPKRTATSGFFETN